MKYYTERFFSIVAALLLLQTLFFKFTAAEESVYIFSELGLEPYGRVAAGVAELMTALLLLYRKTSLIGAVLGITIISGAIAAHLFILGIVVLDDKGLLFALAIIVFVSCSIVLFLDKKELSGLIKQKLIR